MQRHYSQMRTSRRGRLPTPLTAMAVGNVGSCPAGSVGNFKGHCNGQVSEWLLWHGIEARVICMWWRHGGILSPAGRLCGIFEAANNRCWDNYHQFVQRRAPCWFICVRVTVAVNVVCAGERCTCKTCIRAWYRTPTHSGCQRRSAFT